MTRFDVSAVAAILHRMVNAAFQWTEAEACAVATMQRPHKFVININGQEFVVTVTVAK